jgi:hypothetical protein
VPSFNALTHAIFSLSINSHCVPSPSSPPTLPLHSPLPLYFLQQIKDVHCAPKLRGYLYASISSFLKPYIDDDNNTLVSSYLPVIQRKPLPGDVGGSDSDSDSDDGLPATSTKYKVRVSETLECNIMYLIDTVSGQEFSFFNMAWFIV